MTTELRVCAICGCTSDKEEHHWTGAGGHRFIPMQDYRNAFDFTLGRIDRAISEFMVLTKGPLDEPDKQTIKHHAEDMIAAGNAALAKLGIKS